MSPDTLSIPLTNLFVARFQVDHRLRIILANLCIKELLLIDTHGMRFMDKFSRHVFQFRNPETHIVAFFVILVCLVQDVEITVSGIVSNCCVICPVPQLLHTS
jgi:hypothetical protein